MFDPYPEGIWWLCYTVGGGTFCWLGLGPLVPLEWGQVEGHCKSRVILNQFKVILSEQLHALIKYFYLDRSGVAG